MDHQLRIAGDAAIIHVDGTRHFAHKLAHLRRQRLQDLLVLALDAHRHARAAVVEHSNRGGFDDRARDVSAKRTRHIRELSWRANPLVLLLELDEDAGEPRAARAEAAVAADAHRAEDLVYLGQRKQALLDGLRRCVGHVECSAGWHLDGDLHLAVVGLGHELSAEQAGADQHDPADEGQQAGGNHNPARSSPDRDPQHATVAARQALVTTVPGAPEQGQRVAGWLRDLCLAVITCPVPATRQQWGQGE